MRMLEGGARDEDDNEVSVASAVAMARKTFGVIVRSFHPDGSCAIPHDWATPSEVKKWCETEEEKEALRRELRRRKKEVGFAETVPPRAGAGLSEDEALAARFGEAASLDEL